MLSFFLPVLPIFLLGWHERCKQVEARQKLFVCEKGVVGRRLHRHADEGLRALSEFPLGNVKHILGHAGDMEAGRGAFDGGRRQGEEVR